MEPITDTSLFFKVDESSLTPNYLMKSRVMLWLLRRALPLNRIVFPFLCHTVVLNFFSLTFSVASSKTSHCEVMCWTERIPLCFHRLNHKARGFLISQPERSLPFLEDHLTLLSPCRG